MSQKGYIVCSPTAYDAVIAYITSNLSHLTFLEVTSLHYLSKDTVFYEIDFRRILTTSASTVHHLPKTEK